MRYGGCCSAGSREISIRGGNDLLDRKRATYTFNSDSEGEEEGKERVTWLLLVLSVVALGTCTVVP